MTKKASMSRSLADVLAQRFGHGGFAAVEADDGALSTLCGMAKRGSCRSFKTETVAAEVVQVLSGVALSSPTKSDLQQRDIVLLTDPELRAEIASLVEGQDWIADAPHIAIFCGNNRRQRQLHQLADVPFANDHLDAFFNAAVDASVALSAFVTAAEAMGLGCCPISGVRNQVQAVSECLNLPNHVFPVAGLAFGYPAKPPRLSFRLPLSTTVHENTFSEDGWPEAVAPYDRRRHENGDYQKQRGAETFGESPTYSWSDDKVRQYSQAERASFGAYIRSIGFVLD